MRAIESIRPGSTIKVEASPAEGKEATLFEEFQECLSQISKHSTITNQSANALKDAMAAGDSGVKAPKNPSKIDFVNLEKAGSRIIHAERPAASQDKPQVKASRVEKKANEDSTTQEPAQDSQSKEKQVEGEKEVSEQPTDSNTTPNATSETMVAAVVQGSVKEVSPKVEAADETNIEKISDVVFSEENIPVDQSLEQNISKEEVPTEVGKGVHVSSEPVDFDPKAAQHQNMAAAVESDAAVDEKNISSNSNTIQIPIETESVFNQEKLPKSETQVIDSIYKQKGLDAWMNLSQTLSGYITASLGSGISSSATTPTTSAKDVSVSSIIESKNSSSPLNSASSLSPQYFAVQAKSSEGSVAAKQTSKPLPKASEAKTFERVEQALKEAVKSKDGKTISFRLDPPSLGKVQVDVSLKDGALHARIVPESQQVGNFLRERSHELVNSLRKLGLNVEKISISINPDQFVPSETGFSGSSNQGEQAEQDRSSSGFSGSSSQDDEEGYEQGQGKAETQNQLDHWVA